MKVPSWSPNLILVLPEFLTSDLAAFSVVKPATHTIQNLVVGTPSDDFFSIDRLSEHPAMTHAVVFTTQAFYERTYGVSYARTPQFHLAKTLKYLQESLNNPSDATSNSTLSVVASLAIGEVLLGELETAGKHMDGLARMIELRGGFGNLGRVASIEHKARR